MIIAVASGKGGTGKTTVATNLALSIDGPQYIDCDVEEPNGNLFLHAEIKARRETDRWRDPLLTGSPACLGGPQEPGGARLW